ncbi:MAG: ATP-binding protein [Phaeospirillum sp.]|nr:ATP-binding protein [Phaeospirillum sp.]
MIPFVAASLISALAALALTEVYQLQVRHRQEAARVDVVAHLGAVRGLLEGALTAPLLVTRGLVANIIQHGDVSDANFAGTAAIVLMDYPSIRNLTLARGTVIAAVYPLTANQAVLGVDYRSRADQWATVERAIQSRRPVVAGPVNLIQGGSALIGRVPIFLPAKKGGDPSLFGLLSVVIDIPSIFASAGISQDDVPIAVAIRGHDGLGRAGGMVWGDEAIFDRDAVEMDVTLPDGTWRLAATPRDGWEVTNGELRVTRLLGGALWLFVAFASFGTAFYAMSLRCARGRIAESEERYRALVETAPMAVCVHRDGRIIFANTEAHRMVGAPDADGLVGANVLDLVHPESKALAEERISSVMAEGGKSPVAAYDCVTLDGRIINADVASTRVMLDGRPAVLSLIHDVTLQHRAAAERERLVLSLQRSNEDLQQFAYIASHDLQEPLRNVASYVQLLARRYRGRLDHDADEFIGYAVGGARRMQEMITDLLEYSRIQEEGDAGGTTDSRKVVERVLSDLAIVIDESGALVEVDQLPMICCREHELGRIFLNLIGNAIKYRRPDIIPRVRISAHWDDRFWTFSVTDNGIGIAPEYYEQIFSLFTRLHPRSSFGGTGIGLAICRKLIQHNGGRIWVEAGEGQGSRFRFTLPAAR